MPLISAHWSQNLVRQIQKSIRDDRILHQFEGYRGRIQRDTVQKH